MKVNFSYQGLINITNAGRYASPEKGLHLLVKPNGKKNWVMRYTYGGKRQDLALGSFPEVKIGEARQKAQEARYKLNQDINPLEERKQRKKPS
jgi:Arm DNA-binding domain